MRASPIFATTNLTFARRDVGELTPGEPGLYRWTKQIHGGFAVANETDELAADNREANTATISWCRASARSVR